MKASLSVVIPAYNEADNVAECLTKLDEVIKQLKLTDYEIILVDDGSTDKTGQIARSFIKRIPRLSVIVNRPNRGYGGALRTGFAHSKKDFITVYHVDNQFDFSEITQLFAVQKKTGADLVSGIRVGGGADPFTRKFNRWGWNLVIRLLFGFLVTDIDCGFKLFKRELLSNIHLTAERGAMIDTQLLASLKLRGYKFAEIPVTHLPRVRGAATGADLKVIVQSFIDLFKYWWQLKREIWLEKKKNR